MKDLATLKAERDAARERLFRPRLIRHSQEEQDDLDTLLRLHGDVRTLENAEKLEQSANSCFWMNDKAEGGFREAIAFLRTLIPEGR